MQERKKTRAAARDVPDRVTTPAKPTEPPIEELGWTPGEIEESYYRFRPFEELWDAPGMEDHN